MIKHLLLVLTAIIFFTGEALPQCNITASISLASGTNVCANAAVLTALPKSDSWLQKTSFGGSTRSYPCGFNIGSKGYMGLGFNQDDFWEYDPATNAWTQKANYPNSSAAYHLGFSIGTKGYVAGAVFLGEVFYEYDPSTNTWSSKATPGGGTRLAGFVFSVGGKGYIGAGTTNLLVAKNDFWEYTPTTNTWTQKSNFGGGARYNAVGVASGTLGYAGLGINALFFGQNDWWEYNPGTDTWTQKSNYPGSGYWQRNPGFNINGKPCIVEATTNFGTNFYEYSPSADTWATKVSYPGTYLSEAAGFSIGSKGYIGGGSSASDFWEYTSPLTYSWSTGAVTQTISASGSGSFSVVITDVLSCTATASRSMNINPLPNINITGGNVCNGKTTTLTASGATSYTWSSNVGGGTGSTAVVTPSANTFYTISATSPGPCTVSAVKALVLVPNPSATITTSGAASICGTSIALTAAPGANTWTAKANVGGVGRWRAVGFSIGSKGYVGLGLDASFSAQNDLWEYDPATNAWTQKSNAPVPSSNGVAFTIGNKAYAPLGFGTDFYEYDPATNAWTQKTSFPGAGFYLYEAIGFSAGSRGYMGLGTTTMNAKTDEFWEYEPVSNTWSKRANFPPGARSSAYGLGIGNKGYVGGGNDNSTFNLGDLWEYNPSTDTWLQKASWPGSIAPNFAKSFQINNKGYFSPGSGYFHQYDPSTDTWTQKTSMPGGSVIYEIAFSIGDKGYSGTGASGGSYTNSFYEYDPEETFLWSTSAITNSVSVTTTGSYSVIVTSALGCSATAVKAVTVNPIPVITSTATMPAICIGGTTSLSGGGAFTYVWTGGVTNAAAFSPTTTLTYTVTGTAATGCTNTAVKTITVNSLPVVSSTTSNSVICLGGSTSLSGTGATTYTWSNSVTNGAIFSPTTTLTYTVTGTNSANGCTNTAVRTVTVNSLPSVTANATPSVVCLNASLTLSGSGASTYTWSGGVTNGVAFAPSVSGTYTVTGTSAQNCTNTATRSITVNSLPIVTASSGNSVICTGGTTSLNGGGAVSYAWSNSVANGTPFSPTVTASYTVTGTDANTCTNTAVTTITVNNSPSVTANASSTAICIGGTISLSGGGATTYTWAGGIINGSAFAPTLTATYTVTGTDANTCTNTAVRTVTVNALPLVGATASPSIICLNKTTTLNGTGASTYSWTSGVTNGVAFAPGGTATYTVTGTSALNCSNTAAITVTVNSLPIVSAVISNPAVCIGGTTSVSGAGASTYTWNNGLTNGGIFSPTITGTYTVTGTDVNTCTNTAIATVTVHALPTVVANASNSVICLGNQVTLSGSGASTYIWSNGVVNAAPFSPTLTAAYTVTGTAASTGCTNTAVRTITVNNLPIVTANATQTVICLNNTVTLTGGGASTYVWSNGVTNGVSFAPGGTTTYTVIGTSALNCTNSAIKDITVNSLPLITANITDPIICIGGTTTVFGLGGVTYTWTSGVVNATAITPTINTSYTVTGTDANSCTNTAVTNVVVNAKPLVTANASSTAICIGNTVTVFGGGATTYTWSDNITDNTAFSPTVSATYTVIGTNGVTTCTNAATRSVVVNNLPSLTASASNPVICLNNTTTLNGGGALTYTWTNGVSNGVAFAPSASNIYTVTGTDANTCTNTVVASVTVNPLPIVTAGSTHSFLCIGSSVVLSGGGASTYTWTGGVTDGVAFAPVSTSIYTVTGTDLNTCTNTAVTTVTVYNNAPVTANTTSAVICAGDLTTLFGAGAVTFTWTSGVNDSSPFVPSATNSYTVTGTDSNGCPGSAAVSVTVNPLPNVSSTVSQSVICMNHTTSVNGAGAVTYQWTGGVANGIPFSPTSTDNYTVTGTDANGCKNYDTKQIVVNPLPVVLANASNPVICTGDATTLTGGGANFYNWSGGIFDGITFSPMVTTSYTVTGMDLNSCINSAVITVTVNNSPTVTASSSPPVICNGDPTTLSGGGAINYVWTGGISNATPFNPSTTGSYTVIGTAANGCTNSAMTSVTVHALPVVTASASHSVICLNFTTSVSGGGAVTYIWSGGLTNNAAFFPTITDTYSVTGTDANGCQNVAFQTITVNNLPLVSGAATDPVICDGESTSLNGSGAITYTWTNGVIDGTSFSPTLTLTYQVTGTDANTCTNTAIVTVTVNNTPTVTASSSHSVICMNDLTTLNGGGAASYFWTSNITDGTAFSPTVTNSYTVIGTSAEGCTSSAVTSITVNALPNVTGVATSPSLCIGDITSLHGAGAQIYTWSGGVLNGSAFSPITTAVYTVTGTDVNGCVNTNTTLVTVVQKPTITAAVSHTAVCIGESVIFSGAGATSYTWTNGPLNGTPFTPGFSNSYVVIGSTSGCLSNNTVTLSVTVNTLPIVSVANGSICSGGSFTLNATGAITYTFSGGQIVSPASSSSYTVFGTNPEGCVNVTPAVATVSVKALPVILFSATHTKICTGQTATITAIGASTYVWNSGNVSSNIVVSPQTNTVYSVIGTDADMCVGSGSIALAVVNMPIVNLISNVTAACRGAEVSLNASGADTYSWNTGEVGSSIISTPVGSTVYIVTGTNEGTCSQTASISVTIYGIPILNAGADIEIQAGETAQLNATQVGASTYSWTTGEGLSNTSILNPVSTIDHDITYTLMATSSRGCSAKDEVTITVSNGLTIANYMSPNGDGKNDTWKISNLYLVKNYSVDVVDSWGKTVFSKTDNYANEFDGQDLPDGVYYYFIKDGSKLKFKGSITITR